MECLTRQGEALDLNTNSPEQVLAWAFVELRIEKPAQSAFGLRGIAPFHQPPVRLDGRLLGQAGVTEPAAE